MAKRSLLEDLLGGFSSTLRGLSLVAIPMAILGCEDGCKGGIIGPDDDDDTTSGYTAEDLKNSVKCYDPDDNLVELDIMIEDETYRCIFDAPDDFGGDVIISYSGLQEESISINESSLIATITPDMYDANLTTLADGSDIALKDEQSSLTFSIRNDDYVGGMDIELPFDVYVNNEAPTLENPNLDLGRIMVGEDIPGFNILDEAGVTDREDELDGNGDYNNDLKCQVTETPEGLTVDDDCNVSGAFAATGDYNFEVDVIDPQGDFATVTITAGAFDYPTVDVLVSDFFTNGIMTDGNGSDIVSYVNVKCNDQGTPDFESTIATDLTGFASILVESPALAAGTQEVECLVVSDDETDPTDLGRYAAVGLTETVGSGNTSLEAWLISSEDYDSNAQGATGVDNSIWHLFARNAEMESVYGINAGGDLFKVNGGGIITSELVDGDVEFYNYTLSDVINNLDPSINPPGYTGVLVQDSVGGMITIDWNETAGVVDVTRNVTGTNIDSGTVTLDGTYYYDATVEAVGILIASGALSGTVEEGDIGNFTNLTYSNGTDNPSYLGQMQTLIRQYYPHDLNQTFVTFDGDQVNVRYTDGDVEF
ncbi:MAG: hypothetical protein ABIG93_04745 [archaeon]|nr:hypothetical protein [Nanoarchaeota archaeon]